MQSLHTDTLSSAQCNFSISWSYSIWKSGHVDNFTGVCSKIKQKEKLMQFLMAKRNKIILIEKSSRIWKYAAVPVNEQFIFYISFIQCIVYCSLLLLSRNALRSLNVCNFFFSAIRWTELTVCEKSLEGEKNEQWALNECVYVRMWAIGYILSIMLKKAKRN